MKRQKLLIILCGLAIACGMTGCATKAATQEAQSDIAPAIVEQQEAVNDQADVAVKEQEAVNDQADVAVEAQDAAPIDTVATNPDTELFTERDLTQTADISTAEPLELKSGSDVMISAGGTYRLSGSYTDATVIVATDTESKVQLILDGLTIENQTAPAIYVKSSDKVFLTTTDSTNRLSVSGTFAADGETNLDAVVFSKADLVLNGVGSLNIICETANGISSKDDLKITGGTYSITSANHALEANDNIAVRDGTIAITAGKDGLHSENTDDLSLGHIYIEGGSFDITAQSDGIQGTGIVQIDGGNIRIPSCSEGIEGTSIIINNGTIDIYATDDGINATSKSSNYDVVIEYNGGDTTVEMAAGDTDAFDSNGSIVVNGGTITISGGAASFDYNGTGELNGGTVTVNGSVITTMPVQMGGGMGGGMGGHKGDGDKFGGHMGGFQ